MKIKEFLRKEKRRLIFSVTLLIVFLGMMGVFTGYTYSRIHSLQNRVNALTSQLNDLRSTVDQLNGRLNTLCGSQTNTSIGSSSESNSAGSSSGDASNPIASPPGTSSANKNTKSSSSVHSNTANPNTSSNTNSNLNSDSDSNVNTGSIRAGDTFTLTVLAGSVSDLYGYQFNLDYDKNKVTYNGGLQSSIPEIGTIFKKDMSDSILVGATMIGDKSGYTAKNIRVCTMSFTAKAPFDPSAIRISGVNTVDSAQKYIENVSGWSYDVKTN